MRNSSKNISVIIIKDLHSKSLEELAELYQMDSALKSNLLASAFDKTIRLAHKISRKYYGLEEPDIVSYSLEKLDYCLNNYDAEAANHGFLPFFTKILANKFREETQRLTTHKRKIIFYTDNYEAALEIGALNPEIMDDEDIKTFETVQSLKDHGLTLKERQYCELIMQDYSNLDIAKMIGVSITTLSNMRKRIRRKLASWNSSF